MYKPWRKTPSSSRMVPRLAHRQPLPRSWRGKLAHFVRYVRYFPLAFAAAVILLALGFGFFRYVVHSPYFSLEVIQISGNHRVSNAELLSFLREKLSIESGTSTLGIRTTRVTKDIEGIPEILVASVEKRWPNGLIIEVTERSPSGVYVSKNSSLVFDRSGYLFSRATPADLANLDLPVISGLDEQELQRGNTLPADSLKQVREYRGVFIRAAPALAGRISEYHCELESGLTLVLDDGARFLCGHRPPEKSGPVIEALLDNPQLSNRLEMANLFSDLYISVTRRGIELPPAVPIKR